MEKVRSLKEYATLGKRRSFQYMSGVPGFAYNAFFLEEARNSYFEFEQIVILNFWVERVWELGTITSQKLELGVIVEERVIEPSVPQLEGQ